MRLSRNAPGFDAARAANRAPLGGPAESREAMPVRSTGGAASIEAGLSGGSSFGTVGRLDGARMPSVEELALRLEGRQKLSGLDRPANRVSVPDSGVARTAEGRPDATVEHPLYGAYLKDWLESNRAEPGRALLGMFRSTLGELRTAISRNSGKSAPTRPTESS
jgi:hypothetical protein